MNHRKYNTYEVEAILDGITHTFIARRCQTPNAAIFKIAKRWREATWVGNPKIVTRSAQGRTNHERIHVQ